MMQTCYVAASVCCLAFFALRFFCLTQCLRIDCALCAEPHRYMANMRNENDTSGRRSSFKEEENGSYQKQTKYIENRGE